MSRAFDLLDLPACTFIFQSVGKCPNVFKLGYYNRSLKLHFKHFGTVSEQYGTTEYMLIIIIVSEFRAS